MHRRIMRDTSRLCYYVRMSGECCRPTTWRRRHRMVAERGVQRRLRCSRTAPPPEPETARRQRQLRGQQTATFTTVYQTHDSLLLLLLDAPNQEQGMLCRAPKRRLDVPQRYLTRPGWIELCGRPAIIGFPSDAGLLRVCPTNKTPCARPGGEYTDTTSSSESM